MISAVSFSSLEKEGVLISCFSKPNASVYNCLSMYLFYKCSFYGIRNVLLQFFGIADQYFLHTTIDRRECIVDLRQDAVKQFLFGCQLPVLFFCNEIDH